MYDKGTMNDMNIHDTILDIQPISNGKDMITNTIM